MKSITVGGTNKKTGLECPHDNRNKVQYLMLDLSTKKKYQIISTVICYSEQTEFQIHELMDTEVMHCKS